MAQNSMPGVISQERVQLSQSQDPIFVNEDECVYWGSEKSYRVFPFSQYYVQNIEVPLTIESGASVNTYTSIFVSSLVRGSSVKFFGDGNSQKGMFNLSSGYVVKRYDGIKDRLVVDLYGTMSADPLDFSIATYDVNSSYYDLPINSNISINVKEGSNIMINQNIVLLPGAEIRIDEGASGKLKSGIKSYVYDADEWGGYCSSTNRKLWPLSYAPGKIYTRTEADLVDGEVVINGTFDASEGYVYTTQSGANIYSEGTGTVKMQAGPDKITYQVVQNYPNPAIYNEINVSTAKLKNNDGTYLEYDGKHIEFRYSDGEWKPQHQEITVDAVAPNCTEDGKTDGIKCSLCDGWIKEQTVVLATGHTYTNYMCGCGKEKRITSTGYSVDGENIIITPNLTEDDPLASVIMVATYDSTYKLLDSKLFQKNQLENVTFSNKDVKIIKVFSWGGFTTIEPVALCEEISVQ